MSQELKQFDSLAADITLFVAPTLGITVTDDASGEKAIETVKAIKEYTNRVEATRTSLVGPLNKTVKTINDYAKQIAEPLARADAHIRTQLNAYAAKKEAERQKALREAEEKRRAEEEAARLERQRAEAELQAKLEAEAQAHVDAVTLFGAEGGDVETANAELNERLEREAAEKQAELDREAALLKAKHEQERFDANQKAIKGTRKTLCVRVLDLSLVPKEFLIVQLNEKAALAAGKAGVKIPGLEFFEEVSVAIGATTRIPRIGGRS